MNRQETMQLLSMLGSVWSTEPITDEKITVYHAIFERFPFERVKDAGITYMTRGKFFPKPADLLELIAADAVPAISVGEAMQLVQKQINRHGYDGFDRVAFDDPAIMEAVKAIGWRRICLEDRLKGDYVLRDFGEALERAQARQRREVQDGSAAIGAGNVVALDRKAS